jgi:hypothetical protein
MNRRKGELIPSAIDRGRPFQVALPQGMSSGKLYGEQMEFCEKNKLMRCMRGHSVFHDDRHTTSIALPPKRARGLSLTGYGGEWFDPKERGKGLNWNRWSKGSSGRTTGEP